MKKLYTLLMFAFISLGVFAQTTIYTESFEDTVGYTLSHVFDDGFSDYNKRDSAASFSFVNAVTNVNGTFIIGAEDTDAEPTSPSDGVVSIVIDSVMVTGFSNLAFTAAIAAPGGPNYDQCTQSNGDSVLIQVSIDGGAYQRLGFFCSPAGSNQTTMYLDANGNKLGDMGEIALTAALTDFTFPIAGTGNYVKIMVSYRLDSGSEELAFDNFKVVSLPATSCATPAGLGATTGLNDATLTWTNGSGNTLSNIEWGTAGFSQGSGTLITGFNQGSGSLMLNNLMMGTSYDFYVQDSCGSTQGTVSSWAGPFTFTTLTPIPTYQIGTVTTNDANFVPDSIGVVCKLVGIVTSADFDGNAGYNFTIQDGTGGIYIFNFADVNGYQSAQGDEIRVVGAINQFNGLTQLAVDSITLLSSGNSLPFAPSVTMLDETTENELVKVEGAYLADPSQWPTSNTSRNLDIVTPLGDTLVMRIDFDTRIFDSLFVSGADTFTVTGVGGQFDNSAPFNSGYQIFPSVDEDIMITGTAQCANPFGLNAMTTDTTATLMWMNGQGNMYSNVEWGVAGFSQGSGTLIMGFNQGSGSLMLGGLTTGQAYDFYVQDSCATLGGYSMWVGPFTFTPMAPPSIPTYDIATITTVDANGEPDSLGVYCKVVGTVFTPDYDGNNGYSFYIQDGTGGINIFNFSDLSSGYQSRKGDEIRAVGEVLFFNGLIEIQVDSITILSQGNSVGSPTVVTSFDATTVSEFIKIEKVKIVDPSQWPAPGDNANLDIATSTGDTLVMRIDKDVFIQDTMTTAPTGFIDVTGVGGQFDNSAPYFDGYQIFPRRYTDIVDVDPCPAPTGLMAGNLTKNSADLSWTSSNSGAVFNIVWGEAGFLFSQGNVVPGITTTSFTLTGLDDDKMYEFYVQDSCGSFLGNSQFVGPESFSTLIDNVTDVNRVAVPLMAFPNPSNQGVVMLNKVGNFMVFDVLGQEVNRVTNNNRFDATNLQNGVYLVKAENGETIRVIIK
jgi:DNA/RNA endonuclease YhcR with UshA esterase domain